MSDTIIERVVEKKVVKPAPPSEELLSMIERFRPCETKEAMIAKFNEQNNGPSWSPYLRRVAVNAMRMLLTGTAPAPKPVKTETSDLEADIKLDLIMRKPKSEAERLLEAQLKEYIRKIAEHEKKEMAHTLSVKQPEPERKAEPVLIVSETGTNPVMPDGGEEDEELPISKPVQVEGRRKSASLREKIPAKVRK